MVSPKGFEKKRTFDPRLVTKTSLSDPAGAIALLLLLWFANGQSAEVAYGMDSDDGPMQLDPENLARLRRLVGENDPAQGGLASLNDDIRNNPLLASQIESLKAAFELVWHLGFVQFDDEARAMSSERKGGKRYRKKITFSTNVDILAAYAAMDMRAFVQVMVGWLKGQKANTEFEDGIKRILAAFAEISFYKTGKGPDSIIYTTSGVYERVSESDQPVELTEKTEAVGPTRILKSTIANELNPYLQETRAGIIRADSVTAEDLAEYAKRAKLTLDLSMVEIKKTDNGAAAYEGEIYDNQQTVGQPHNLIFFGAPGTGKSHILDEESKEHFAKDKIERVTFHPDYTYAQFVGSLKPHSGVNDDGKHEVYYAYTPGPFIDTYVKAMNDPGNDYLLIIEELNRANPAAVFGDVFQLLDRDDMGKSDYPIKTSEELCEYLQANLRNIPPTEEGRAADNLGEIVNRERVEIASRMTIPPNMYLWATMNSSDQGVFPMDTAFKRRWSFRYMDIDNNEDAISELVINLGNTGRKAKWNDFRKRINEILLSTRVSEDKLLGPFFIDPGLIEDEKAFNDAFKSKVLLYLIEDAAKTKKANVFQMENPTYSAVAKAFDTDGENIFRGMESLPTYSDNARDEHGSEGVDEEVEQ